MWVSWKLGKLSETARVEDVSISGAFIVSEKTVLVGTRLELHFSLPEGQVQVQAVVRNVREGRGFGAEFVSMRGKDFELMLAAIKRLLG
jgi:hypothetical protein